MTIEGSRGTEPGKSAATPEDESAAAKSSPRLVMKALGVVVVVALLVLLAWATLAAGRGKSLVAEITAGQAPSAPAFEREVIWTRTDTWPARLRRALDDERLTLEELRGYPVVLNFWASWCLPCRDEAPILNASAKAHRGEVVFVGIDVQDLRGDALDFLREFDVPYVSVRDVADDTYRAYGLTGVPETYFLGADGRIVAHSSGAISRDSLEKGIVAARSGEPRKL